MIFSWFRQHRRRRLSEEPIPTEWRHALQEYVRHYSCVEHRFQQRLEQFVNVFVAEKEWVATENMRLSDWQKAVIAAYAGVMTLGLPEPYYFERLPTIIVYPSTFTSPASRMYPDHYWYESHQPRLGESWHRGPIILSWADIQYRDPQRPGHNLVIHEFAHHVDGLAGDMDGMPPLVGSERRRTWQQVTEREYQQLVRDTRDGRATLLDVYGATNQAEFFAVASECFFELPRSLRGQHPELYQILRDFYGQDSAAWLPDA